MLYQQTQQAKITVCPIWNRAHFILFFQLKTVVSNFLSPSWRRPRISSRRVLLVCANWKPDRRQVQE